MSDAARKIFIATPTANGLMLSDYVVSLMAMTSDLHARGVATTYRTVDGPNVIVQRDILAHDFLASDCSHLLFVDSDMAFPADLAWRLLETAKQVIGTVYSRRGLDLDRLQTLLAGRTFDQALALAHDWNVHFLDNTITVKDGLCRVEALGTGFLLIARSCFTDMVARLDVPFYQATHAPMRLRAYFRELRNGGAVWSHDYAFCKRWVAAGGEVWADASANLRHVGDFRFGMPFTAYLQAMHAQVARPGTPAPVAPGAPEGSAP